MSENAPTRSLDDIDLAALRVSERESVFTYLHLPEAFTPKQIHNSRIYELWG